jgi:hypothetical protein
MKPWAWDAFTRQPAPTPGMLTQPPDLPAMSTHPLPVRSPLDILQLDFPHHRITLRNICGKLFYLAEAASPHVQPRFAQAETTGRLRAKLQVPLRDFTTSEPSIPRVWDYLLGGKDNFAADRLQADALLDIYPGLAELAWQARQFQRRAVAYVAGQGVRQFIDIGCGLPTAPNTHETAQDIQPGAKTVYVDNDELVLSHAQNILEKTAGVLAVAGDLAYPDEILYDWRVRNTLSFHEPVCLILAMTLHFFDAGKARRIVAQLTSSIPDGSYVIVSTGQLKGEAATRFTREYQPEHTYHHTPADLTAIMDSLELAAPGITEARTWRRPAPVTDESRPGHIWAAVGRKASATS